MLGAILEMLESAAPKKRAAAAVVIGALAPDGDEALEALRRASANKDDAELRRCVVEAIGSIEPASIVRDLIPLVRDPDRRVRRAVKDVLSSSKNVKVEEVAKMMETSDEKQCVAAISVLGAMGGADSRRRLLGKLKGSSTRVASAIVDALRPNLIDGEGEEIAEAIADLDQLLVTEDVVADPDFGLAGIQLLGHTENAGAAGALGRIAGSAAADDVRLAALETMQRLVRGRGNDNHFEALLGVVEEPGTSEAVQKAALNVMANLDVPRPLEPRVRALVDSEETHRRRWAIQALGGVDGARAADALAGVVAEGAPADRELALASALTTQQGRAALARLLGRVTESDRASQVAKGLRGLSQDLCAETKHALEQSVMEAPPEIGKIILGVLKMGGGSSAGKVQESLLDKAVLMKNKRQFDDAIVMLRSLAGSADADPEIRFQLGICELKTSKRKIVRGQNNDVCLTTLTTLLKHKEFPLLQRVVDEKVLEPEDLYYLGFSCAERSGPENGFGGDLLVALSEAAPDSKHGKMAHNKLVTMGWAE